MAPRKTAKTAENRPKTAENAPKTADFVHGTEPRSRAFRDAAASLDAGRHPAARSMAEELDWQVDKLDAARKLIKNTPVIMPYDNGGGQSGYRKNPAYDAYNALFSSFTKGVALFDAMLDGADAGTQQTVSRLADMRRELKLVQGGAGT